MKEFNPEAAKKGARVCTMGGLPIRILCFDLKPDNCIVAVVKLPDHEAVGVFRSTGEFVLSSNIEDSLMMADDDYKEKLARGEYSTQETASAPAPTTDMATSTDPWDEFKRQAALEILRQRGCFVGQDAVDGVIRDVTRLVEGLKGK